MSDTLPAEPANQAIPFRRDPATGLIVGQTYRYTPEGRIDYRAMVPVKYLYVAHEYRDRVIKEQGKALADIDLLQVKDDWLRIRIGGLNHLAHMRGVRSCTYPQLQTREGFAAAVCQITFVGNVETNMEPETWSAMASATIRSVDKQFIPYLETFAENRSFGRCIKRALQINILSDIEVGGESRKAAGEGEGDAPAALAEEGAAPTGFQPFHYLITKCRDNKAPDGKPQPITFAALREAAVKMNAETPTDKANERCISDPKGWEGFESIPPADVWLLMGKIEAKAKEEGGKKAGKAKA
ncbi:MAG: hypothetical protein Q7O66_06400 [Dehalococcoidia bacterium]|nr:hypothetical protein [Dehalococcoidia bacterium]